LTSLDAGSDLRRETVMRDARNKMFQFLPRTWEDFLAVTTPTPLVLLPGVPTVGEFVPGFEAGGWQGICAPSTTPSEVVDRLNRETNAVLADGTSKARLAQLGGQVFAGTPADFGNFIAAETDKWGKVIRQAGISAN